MTSVTQANSPMDWNSIGTRSRGPAVVDTRSQEGAAAGIARSPVFYIHEIARIDMEIERQRQLLLPVHQTSNLLYRNLSSHALGNPERPCTCAEFDALRDIRERFVSLYYKAISPQS